MWGCFCVLRFAFGVLRFALGHVILMAFRSRGNFGQFFPTRRGKGSGRAFCVKRSEREQGREIAKKKKVQALIKILRNRAL
jgi:hypothetical protein